MNDDMREAEAFFYERAGTSWNPATESEEEGRRRGAREMALAEARLKAGNYIIGIKSDPDPWNGDVPWDGPVWMMTLYRSDDTTVSGGKILSSMGGIAAEENDPYLRVVAAELALEAIPDDEYIVMVSTWNGAISDEFEGEHPMSERFPHLADAAVLLASRIADLPRRGERTESGGTVISTGDGPGGLWALNLAQLDQMICDARDMLHQPERRPD